MKRGAVDVLLALPSAMSSAIDLTERPLVRNTMFDLFGDAIGPANWGCRATTVLRQMVRNVARHPRAADESCLLARVARCGFVARIHAPAQVSR